ncbi:MAG: protein translocase subunit SecD [Epsilonproteobacteria bacterium]|nr:MAG: protein translocase subunit SecD [Campylobacterota bacterium]RLA68044.1 MAG: protein translocase subunit SecD [Campylobacterota bacterium]
MKRNWWYRFSFLIAMASLAIFVLVPTVLKFDRESTYPVKSRLNLGLDLQGGLYMVLGIDFKKVYQDEIKGYARRMEFLLNDEGIKAQVGSLNKELADDPFHSIRIVNPVEVAKAKELIKKYFGSVIRLTHEEDEVLTYGLSKITKTNIEEQSVTKSIEVIRNRIDEFGVTEPEIVSQGDDRIVVQLPGVKDIERAKELIGKTAKLEFKMVNDKVSPATLAGWLKKTEAAGINFKKGQRFSEYIQTVNEYLKKDIPEGYELAFEKKVNKLTNELTTKIPYLVEATPQLTGEALQDARVQIDQQKNQPYVSLNFKSAGAKAFEEITGKNIGNRMAIILDGNVYSAPNIQAKIGGGRAQITLGTGGYNKMLKEARDLALVLRAGALPVQLDFLEQRTVGPSLGEDSIMKARTASLIGAALVFLFILFYYKLSGAIAIVSLVLNIIFVLGILVGFDATLTLPGIAGIALTIGMAVDANIIIYERIREEVRKGLGYYKAVEGGFAQAFWTILDANVTTALAGLCLLNFGTGPIKGFAVTLLIGIFATIYTAYFVSKLLFEFYMNKVEGQDLSI